METAAYLHFPVIMQTECTTSPSPHYLSPLTIGAAYGIDTTSSFLNCSIFNCLEVKYVDSGALELLQFVSQISRLLNRLLDETAANWQISPSEVRILLFLSCAPHLDTARDVALHCGMSKASVSGNVLKLVTRGLLTAEMDLSDRRFQRLALTDQASPVMDDVWNGVRQFQAQTLGILPEEEASRFFDSLLKISHQLGEFDHTPDATTSRK